MKGHAIRFARSAAVVIRNFMEHECLLRASALSYTTILSLVPLFAVAFAILKGLGVQNTLEPLILRNFTGGSGEVVEKIVTYINNTKMGSIGAIGLAALIITVISLLGSIEDTFNRIWGVEENRTIYRKFTDYVSVVLSGPLLLLVAVSATTGLESQSLVQWLVTRQYFGDILLFLLRFMPYLNVWIALVCLYMLIPNTRVKFGSASLGAVLAGTIWHTAQWGYIHFQVGVAKYNAIYGTLSALPVFMVWIYTSWLIVLMGAEVVAAHMSRRSVLHDFEPGVLSYATREWAALEIMLSIAASFFRGERPRSVESLADELRLPVRTIRKLLAKLTDAGYLVITEGAETYYPAREPERVRVGDFLNELRHLGEDFPQRADDEVGKATGDVISRRERGARDSLEEMTLRDLVLRLEDQDKGESDRG